MKIKNLFYFLILSLFITNFTFAQKVVYATFVDSFHDGMAAFEKDNKWGFINTEGKVVVEAKYQSGFDTPFYSNGLALVFDPSKSSWGYFDKQGNVAIDFTFYNATPFYDSLATSYIPGSAADPNSYAHWRIINMKGEIVVNEFPNHHSFTTYIKEGLAQFNKDFKYGFVDKKGKIKIKNIYDEARDFSNGFAAVKLNEKWGIIDTAGNVKVDFQFTNEPMPVHCGRTFVLGANFKFALIDTSGKIIVDPEYKQVFPFNEGFTVVSKMDDKYQETWYIIDVNGKVIKEFKQTGKEKDKIAFYSGFSEGLAVAQQGYGANRGFIDTKGKVVIPFDFSMKLGTFNNGLAYAEKFEKKTNKKTAGFIDKKGKFVLLVEQPKF